MVHIRWQVVSMSGMTKVITRRFGRHSVTIKEKGVQIIPRFDAEEFSLFLTLVETWTDILRGKETFFRVVSETITHDWSFRFACLTDGATRSVLNTSTRRFQYQIRSCFVFFATAVEWLPK
jgi:hypothetical protein